MSYTFTDDYIPPLTLHGIPVYVSGVAGHFVNAVRCNLRMCWRVGMLRISTVGGYLPDGPGSPFEQVGSGRWSETVVLRVADHPLKPEGIVTGDRCGVATSCVASDDTREAERLHILVATEIAKVTAGPKDELTESEVELAVALARARMGQS